MSINGVEIEIFQLKVYKTKPIHPTTTTTQQKMINVLNIYFLAFSRLDLNSGIIIIHKQQQQQKILS